MSKQFYENFGEQVANELVDAFNQVDATYRSDLKEMNESNFARFDAKLDARFAQFELRFAQFEAKQDVHDARIEAQIERGFSAQARFILLCWATSLAATVAGILALK